MFNPVAFDHGKYPEVQASVGSPYGVSLTGPTAGMENARGGPVYGMASISEPNTSPTTVTVCVRFRGRFGVNGLPVKKAHLPSGTPIALDWAGTDNMPRDRHGEPIHDCYVINDDDVTEYAKTPWADVEQFKLEGNDGAVGAMYNRSHFNSTHVRGPRFITVTMGDVFVSPTLDSQNITIVVENVAPIHVEPRYMHNFKDVAVGDKLVLTGFHRRLAVNPNVATDAFEYASWDDTDNLVKKPFRKPEALGYGPVMTLDQFQSAIEEKFPTLTRGVNTGATAYDSTNTKFQSTAAAVFRVCTVSAPFVANTLRCDFGKIEYLYDKPTANAFADAGDNAEIAAPPVLVQPSFNYQ